MLFLFHVDDDVDDDVHDDDFDVDDVDDDGQFPPHVLSAMKEKWPHARRKRHVASCEWHRPKIPKKLS